MNKDKEQAIFDLYQSEVLRSIKEKEATKRSLIHLTQQLFSDCPSDDDAFAFVCDLLLGRDKAVLIMILGIRVLGKLNLSMEQVTNYVKIGVLEKTEGEIAISEPMELAVDRLEKATKEKGISLQGLLLAMTKPN